MATFQMTRIELPEWARKPETELDGVSETQYQAIQQHRNKLLQVVHEEILDYMNDLSLVADGSVGDTTQTNLY